MSDYIDRQAAINTFCMLLDNWFNTDWRKHINVVAAIEQIPSVQPDGWLARHRDEILKAGMEGREFEFRIGGRLFAIREKAQ